MYDHEIEKTLAAFSLGQIQDYITLSELLVEAAITIEDLTAYVDAKKQGIVKKTGRAGENMPDCPVCGGKLGLLPVKAPQGRANINGWQSLWLCLSDGCNYEKYTSDDVKTAMVKKEGGI